MSWNTTDIMLCGIVLVGAYYAYQTIPDTLNHIRNLAACPEQSGPGPQKQLQKDAENAISLNTLRILSEGHSYDLRASTIKIVASRTLKSRTKKLLLKDLASGNEDRRYNAMCGMWMLLFNPSLQSKHLAKEFLDYKSFHAVITALKDVLADHRPEQLLRLLTPGHPLYPEPKIPPSPVKPGVRPFHEVCLMMILRVLLDTTRAYDAFSLDPRLSEFRDNISCALSAGLVTRWLKDYPFPCALPQNSKYNYKKSDVVNLFERRAWANDDPYMSKLIEDINMTTLGKKQLYDAGLRGPLRNPVDESEATTSRWSRFPSRYGTLDSDRDVRMTNGESTAGAATPPPIELGGARRSARSQAAPGRPNDFSVEEETLRRRRREAVVVAEPGAPLSQENILQRTDSGNAWLRHTASRGTDDNESLGTDSSPGVSSDPVADFDWVMVPVRSEHDDFERFRNAALTDSNFDHGELVDRYRIMVTRLQQHRDMIASSLDGWGLNEEQQNAIANRVSRGIDYVLDDTRYADLRNSTWNEEANGEASGS